MRVGLKSSSSLTEPRWWEATRLGFLNGRGHCIKWIEIARVRLQGLKLLVKLVLQWDQVSTQIISIASSSAVQIRVMYTCIVVVYQVFDIQCYLKNK